jgi:hypothetical protein
MEAKLSEDAIQGIIDFLEKQAAHRVANTRGVESMGRAALDSFKNNYAEGGLEAVDALITLLNKELIARGSLEGLREGCALEESRAGTYLHIVFVNLSTDKVLARETIVLSHGNPSPAPD